MYVMGIIRSVRLLVILEARTRRMDALVSILLAFSNLVSGLLMIPSHNSFQTLAPFSRRELFRRRTPTNFIDPPNVVGTLLCAEIWRNAIGASLWVNHFRCDYGVQIW